MTKKLNILLIDSPLNNTFGLKPGLEILNSEYNIVMAGSVENADEQIKKRKVNAVILNIDLQDKNKLLFIKQLKNKSPEIIVILFSYHAEIFSSIYQKKFHANFFIDKLHDFGEIEKALSAELKKQAASTGKMDKNPKRMTNFFDKR